METGVRRPGEVTKIPDNSRQSSFSILIVEDSPADARLILRRLRKSSIEVEDQLEETVEGVRQALTTRRFDLILSDFALSGFTAFDVVAMARKHLPDTPIIVVSGAIGEDTAVRLMQLGVKDYILKDHLSRLPLAVQREIREARIRDMSRERESRAHQVLSLLTQGFKDLSGGDLSVRIGEDNLAIEDEFSEVLGYFNETVESLQASQDFMARLQSMATHDLRSPLSTVLLSLETLKKNPDAPEESRSEWIGVAKRNARSLVGRIDDLLALFLIRSDQLSCLQLPTDVDRLLMRCEADMAPLALARRQALLVERMSDPAQVLCDPDKTSHILENLVGNAIKYSGPGSRIRVVANPIDSRTMRIAVSDNGPGVPRDEQEKIFDSSIRGSETRDQISGSGLGLTICRELVRRQGGDICLQSTPGEGACFSFTLPRPTANGDSVLNGQP